jgi:hypothetical protein
MEDDLEMEMELAEEFAPPVPIDEVEEEEDVTNAREKTADAEV